jgi:hypothetical protein
MSVTEYIEDVPFCYRIVSDYKEVYIQWHMKDLPHLFTGRASSHEEKIEQYKQSIKELKKMNNNRKKTK